MMMIIIIIIIPLVLSSRGIIPNKLKESLKLPNLLPGLHIVMQKAVIFDTCHTVMKFWKEQSIRSA
jgi:hypothetical protein